MIKLTTLLNEDSQLNLSKDISNKKKSMSLTDEEKSKIKKMFDEANQFIEHMNSSIPKIPFGISGGPFYLTFKPLNKGGRSIQLVVGMKNKKFYLASTPNEKSTEYLNFKRWGQA